MVPVIWIIICDQALLILVGLDAPSLNWLAFGRLGSARTVEPAKKDPPAGGRVFF
jgi:hypothetical protein